MEIKLPFNKILNVYLISTDRELANVINKVFLQMGTNFDTPFIGLIKATRIVNKKLSLAEAKDLVLKLFEFQVNEEGYKTDKYSIK
jgi:ribosomal protein L7/L12